MSSGVGSGTFEQRGSTAVELVYSTYLGGLDWDDGAGIAVDGSGCSYVTGETYASDFPTQNAIDATFNGFSDVFVTKLSTSGNSLIYSTYLGGSYYDNGAGIAVDGSGCAYVTGSTGFSDFPTQNAFDASWNGGYDAFVTKLSASGNLLIYSTYLGGTYGDSGGPIAVDGSGCAYLTGDTQSSDFPTQNAFDASWNDGYDAFVTKLSSSGNSLMYSTYLGGSDYDFGGSIAVDGSGCVYVTGWTESSDFPMLSALDVAFNGFSDVFVTKLSASGSSLIYSTYLGGSDYDNGSGIAVDGSGCAYVTGDTYSSDFPTQNAFDASWSGVYDAFVTKLSASGNLLVYSTYLGGFQGEWGGGVAVDSLGCAYVTGETFSSDFPTQNAFDATLNGSSDVFVTKFSAAGNSLIYSTYLGGSYSDGGRPIAVDGSGCAYVTGSTNSSNFPTQNPYQGSYQGGYHSSDAFVTKLSNPCGDSDADGICEGDDNCPTAYNPFQEDYDLDGIGDVCDACSDFPPVITDADTVFAKMADTLRYYPTFVDPDGPVNTISYLNRPYWCQVVNDSLIGEAPDSAFSELIAVIVADTCNADTAYIALVVAICGDANSDLFVDIDDIMFLIRYAFLGGPPPLSFVNGDVNCTEFIDIDDIMYLINYVFLGGPVPCKDCWEE
jgi:hypothetical protein